MSTEKDLGKVFNDYINNLKKVANDLTKRLQELSETEIENTLKNSYTEYAPFEQAELRRIFNDAVDTFYNDYTPVEYDRTHSLYNVLDFKTDEYGMVISNVEGYRDFYDESKMVKGRHGQSLFDTVFVEGWHGGAASINPDAAQTWGVHPQPGTPYYRTSGWVLLPGASKKVRYKYAKWGQMAVQSKSVYMMVHEGFDEAIQGILHKKLSEIVHKHNDVMVKNIKEQAPIIYAELCAQYFK